MEEEKESKVGFILLVISLLLIIAGLVVCLVTVIKGKSNDSNLLSIVKQEYNGNVVEC